MWAGEQDGIKSEKPADIYQTCGCGGGPAPCLVYNK
ncbi:hypothetical protein COPEUT_01425 [Coprococcus eutactus ATCC 27759]|nr:hypothetical protein COPEUT_01425 [Coprococcus eutactus ATCC 27759]